uniref:Fungal lipase-type domain-containing protein n=2 Tax=Kalanchoe fedtschenkoi TaxID=63787 RepID=A0A7N0VHP6_KALFE
MVRQYMKYAFQSVGWTQKVIQKEISFQNLSYNLFCRYQSQWINDHEKKQEKKEVRTKLDAPLHDHDRRLDCDSHISKESSDDEEPGNSKWSLEIDWLSKALEPALGFWRWALPTGNGFRDKSAPVTRSVSEIIASIQRSRVGIQDWSLSDLTIGLYLLYLRQASANPFEDIKGIQISSEAIVQDLIYHSELAKGSYKGSAAGLARHSMLREGNVLKFIKESSVLRPGYYLGVDKRRKLVIFGIRGTHTVYDLITSIASFSNEEITSEGYSTHFGTAEAAQWFLTHELRNIRKCLEKHEGYRLRLVGHSLGGAIASVMAIMLRKKTHNDLGFSPDIVSAVACATPPCVSRETADSCFDYVTTIVMQDDIIPRLSVATLTRLRNEIIQTDWTSILDKDDWRSILELVTNAKQVVSSVQDVAKKLAQYARINSSSSSSDTPARKEALVSSSTFSTSKLEETSVSAAKKDQNGSVSTPELFIPGTVYYLQRSSDTSPENISHKKGIQQFTLWKRNPGNHFKRILLSSNLISDHKCNSHYYALRDVLKGLPGSPNPGVFDN